MRRKDDGERRTVEKWGWAGGVEYGMVGVLWIRGGGRERVGGKMGR